MTHCVGSPIFAIGELPLEKLPLAWPLARSRAGASPLSAWLQAVGKLYNRGGGVLAAEGEDGLIHGLAIFEVVRNDCAELIMRVDTLITFEMSAHKPVRQALLEALSRRANERQCECVWSAPLYPSRISATRD